MNRPTSFPGFTPCEIPAAPAAANTEARSSCDRPLSALVRR